MTTHLSQREQRFKSSLKSLLEKVGYRDGIGLLQWDVTGRGIEGKFVDRDGSKAFEFSVGGEGVAYKPLTRVRADAYTKGLSLVLVGTSGNVSYLQGRQDARRGQKKNCTSPTAYSCGNACIHKSKQCRIKDARVRQASLALVKEANFIKAQKTTQSISAQELERRVVTEENKIRGLNYERGLVIDSKTGQVLINKGGRQTQVDFTPDEVAKFKGNVLTHNHPNVWDVPPSDPRYKGVSFSPADVRTAALGEAAEMRAVSNGYTHSMKPPRGGWNVEFYDRTVAPVYEKHSTQVFDEIMTEIWSGKITTEQAEVDYHHRIWQRTAKETGMRYGRTEIRQALRRAA